MRPRTRELLVAAAEETAIITGLSQPNRSSLNVPPFRLGEQAVRQLRRTCLGARRYVIPEADNEAARNPNRNRGAVPKLALGSFVETIRPVWTRNRSEPFNGSYKATLALEFVTGVLAIGGFQAKRVSVFRAMRAAAISMRPEAERLD